MSSLLAQRALATLLATGVVTFSNGQTGIGRDAVVSCVRNLLREQGLSAKAANDRIANALNAVPRLQGPGVHGNFISLRHLQSMCTALGFRLPPLSFEIHDDSGDGDRPLLVEPRQTQVVQALDGGLEILSSDDDDERQRVAVAAAQPAQAQAAQPVAVAVRPAPAAQAMHAQHLLAQDKPDLVRLCLKQHRQLQTRDARIKDLNKKLLCAKRALAKEEKKQSLALAIKNTVDDAFTIRKLGKQKDGRGGRFSLQSMFSIGLRKSLTHVAAADFGVLSMTDISQQTVIRCEHRAAAALLHSFQCYVAEGVKMSTKEPGTPPDAGTGFNLFAVGYRSDATNSSIWRRKKLHVLEAAVSFICDDGALKAGNFAAGMTYRRCVLLGKTLHDYMMLSIEHVLPVAGCLCLGRLSAMFAFISGI